MKKKHHSLIRVCLNFYILYPSGLRNTETTICKAHQLDEFYFTREREKEKGKKKRRKKNPQAVILAIYDI